MSAQGEAAEGHILQFCLAGQERILWAFLMDTMGTTPIS